MRYEVKCCMDEFDALVELFKHSSQLTDAAKYEGRYWYRKQKKRLIELKYKGGTPRVPGRNR